MIPYSTIEQIEQEWRDRLEAAVRAEREACMSLWEASKITDKQIAQQIEAAVQAEREACAAIVQDNADNCIDGGYVRDLLDSNAAAIRARGEA